MQSLKKIHAWAQMEVPLCCFGLCIQLNDVLEGDIYRPDQD